MSLGITPHLTHVPLNKIATLCSDFVEVKGKHIFLLFLEMFFVILLFLEILCLCSDEFVEFPLINCALLEHVEAFSLCWSLSESGED